ncbi:interferon gamma receptor 1 [Microcaecilia unicolor]|uniref:Interferon gamma receptor 1 n=1 Tax=Microcaecilia unicolor TaxID=1415580 RepID=A0A6P7XV76_9AMPH|nr:interferon gamma receptor 1 [Microcaecilia unicolor]
MRSHTSWSLSRNALVILLLLQHDTRATASQSTVPAPTQLMIESYNFKTMLYWNYSRTMPTPHFSVVVQDYMEKKPVHIKTCENITQYFCDISHQVMDPDSFYNVMVKAVVESKESSYTVRRGFSLRTDGKIGPPELKVTEDDSDIIVEIWHPVTPYQREDPASGLETVRDMYDDFTYTVFDRSGNKYKPEECDEQKCIVKIPHHSNDLYVSAQGESITWAIAGETSEEKLLNVTFKEPAKGLRYSVFVTVAALAFTIVLIILAVLFIKLLKKKNIQLPKSLVSVVRSFGSRHITVESEHTCIVTTEPSSPVGPDESLLQSEEPMEAQKTSNNESIEEANTSHLLETSKDSIEEETERSCTEMTHSGGIKAYSVTNKNGPEAIILDSEVSEVCPESNTNHKPLPDIPNRNTSFGYNKPHAPLEVMLVVGEGETVHGYSPNPRDVS